MSQQNAIAAYICSCLFYWRKTFSFLHKEYGWDTKFTVCVCVAPQAYLDTECHYVLCHGQASVWLAVRIDVFKFNSEYRDDLVCIRIENLKSVE